MKIISTTMKIFLQTNILIICITITLCLGQNTSPIGNAIPKSPCPFYFRYSRNDQNALYGLLNIPSPELGKTLKVIVEISIASRLTAPYVGSLELANSKTDALQKMMRNYPIKYKLNFPVQNPIPRIKSIVTNGQVICTGTNLQSLIVTTIRLENILHSQGNPRQLSLKFRTNKQISDYDYEYDENFLLHDSNSHDDEVSKHWNENPKLEEVPNQLSGQVINGPEKKEYEIPLPATNIITQPQIEPQSNSLIQNERDEDICGKSGYERVLPLVAGGKTVARGSYPWLAAVYTTDAVSLSYKCAGTLISKRTILTAAHCIHTGTRVIAAKEIVVSLGRHNIRQWQLDNGSIIREAIIVSYHPDFMRYNSQSYDADIGVIIMKSEVEYNQYVRPICLWRGSTDISNIVGKMGKVVGWGRDPNSNRILTNEPNEIDIPIVSNENCLSSHPLIPKVASNRTFCAGRRDDTGPCNGDSGGALAIKVNNQWIIRGIVSVAIPQSNSICNLKHFVLFTDVAKFTDWILMYVNI